MFRIKTGDMSEAALVLYANSITLTPGTVTVDITNEGFLVHALTNAMADDVKSDDMGKRVRQVDGAGS
jgi:multicomponent Na+:H+ antiporter subunit E